MKKNGGALRRLRLRQGLALRRAAAIIGIDFSHLARIERGAARPHAKTAKKIADAYLIPDAERGRFFPGVFA